MRRDRDDLFRFITRRDVPYTNNACERAAPVRDLPQSVDSNDAVRAF
jgi:hypothetical protein